MATIDCRIGGTADFIVKAGETWQAQLNLTDKNNTPIPLAGFTIGPLIVYRRHEELFRVETNQFTIDGTSVIINKDIPADIRANLNEGYDFKCPFLPPGGHPIAIVTGKIKVDA